MATTLAACRICGSNDLFPVIDLGEQPHANGLPLIDDPAEPARYPLAVVCCAACSSTQLTVSVPPTTLFGEYLYFSSYSTSLVESMDVLATELIASEGLNDRALVAEIGSNDGYLLQHYQRRGIPVLGIEPAANVAAVATARGIPTMTAFFDVAVAGQIKDEHGPARIIHANNVLAHIDDLNGVMEGISTLLSPNGVAVMEVAYLDDLVGKVLVDTIYHEHVFYHSLTALSTLVERHRLAISHVQRLPVHGGSLRVFLRPASAESTAAVRDLLDTERAAGVGTERYFAGFIEGAHQLRDRLRRDLADRAGRGQLVAGYAAAAKTTVLCNYCEVSSDWLAFVVDANPHKQGRRIPGPGIPIGPLSWIDERRPDALLLFAWNLTDEIRNQQTGFVSRGGELILPNQRTVSV